MKQEVQWFLVERLSIARGRRGLDDSAQARAAEFAGFSSAVQAFRYLDAMSDEEVQDWNNRMLVALGVVPPKPAPPGVSQAVWLGEGEPPRHDAPSTTPRFLRQVLGPDREIELFGGRLRVLSVEVYEGATVVRWRDAPEPDVRLMFPEETAALERDIEGTDGWAADHLRGNGEQQLRRWRLYSFDLEDDVGTEYRHAGVGSAGRPGEMSGEARFVPEPRRRGTNSQSGRYEPSRSFGIAKSTVPTLVSHGRCR